MPWHSTLEICTAQLLSVKKWRRNYRTVSPVWISCWLIIIIIIINSSSNIMMMKMTATMTMIMTMTMMID